MGTVLGAPMESDDCLKRFGLKPSTNHLEEIRALLREEIARERSGRLRREDLALLCCVQLFAAARVEDCLLIWNAKSAGFDLGCLIDLRLLCGAGLEATIAYLEANESPQSRSALEAIRQSMANGDLTTFSPEVTLDEYRVYFRTP